MKDIFSKWLKKIKSLLAPCHIDILVKALRDKIRLVPTPTPL